MKPNRILLWLAVSSGALAGMASAQYPYGAGTPGTGGVIPRLDSGQPWLGNASFAYTLQRGVGGAPASVLFASAPGSTPLLGASFLVSVLPGELLLALPVGLGGASGVAGAGSATIPSPLSIAPQPSLLGQTFYLQALVLDSGSPSGPLSASPGLRVELTDTPQVFLSQRDFQPGGDPFTILNPYTLDVLSTATAANLDDVTGSAFGRGGQDLFAASWRNQSIEFADASTLPLTWSNLCTFASPAHGVAHDSRTRRLFTFVGPDFGPKDLVVVDGDPGSPAFGSELARLTGIAQEGGAWSLSASGERLAFFAGPSANNELRILDTDPASATYLQIVAASPVPGLQIPVNGLGGVHMTPDDRIVLVLMTMVFVTAPSGLHRFDLAAEDWIDHGPNAGVQGIGFFSEPQGPGGVGQLAMSRDGSFAVMSGFQTFWRYDFDRDDPSEWSVTAVTGSWTGSTSYGTAITADNTGVLLLAPSVPLSNSIAWLLDVQTGAVRATANLTGAPWSSVIAQR